MWRTLDGGLTWNDVELPLTFAFAIVPTEPTTLLAHVSDLTDAGHYVLMVSRDGGQHWTRTGVGLPPNTEIKNIAVDSEQPTRLFAGTNGRGVFVSTDTGATWRPTGGLH